MAIQALAGCLQWCGGKGGAPVSRVTTILVVRHTPRENATVLVFKRRDAVPRGKKHPISSQLPKASPPGRKHDFLAERLTKEPRTK